MKIVPRILLWIYALGVAIASGFVLFQYAMDQFSSDSLSISLNDDKLAAAALLFFLVSIIFLLYRTKGRRMREPESVTNKMEHGDVKITYETLEQLATRAAAKIRGVQDLKTRARMNENGALRIGVRFAIEPDLDIPKTTAELQETIKSYIEMTTSIPVEQVAVYVTQLAMPREVVKKRVE